jgi:crotonobetainyl-CoA:carnitine CoA-transferase CaiB-like acyl-CoA transferase
MLQNEVNMVGLLEGYTIIDLSRNLPGPYCTMLLGDLGAEVIRIEDPSRKETIREIIPGLYETVNRNKLSVALDLKHPCGTKIFCDLVAKSQVVVEAFRPGVAQRLGIDFPALKTINPSIVYCSITGYGQTGPYEHRPGHDLNYVAMAGALSFPSAIGQPPQRPSLPLADLSGSMFAAVSILAALLGQRSDRVRGVQIDVSMLESAISWGSVRAGKFILGGEDPTPEEMGHLTANNDVYQSKDGSRLSIGALEEHFWRNLCKALGKENLLLDERFSSHNARIKNFSDLRKIIEISIAQNDRAYWMKQFDLYDVPCAPVYTFSQACKDPQVISRQLISLTKNESGEKLCQVLFPVVFSQERPPVRRPPPEAGEHTEEILRRIGYTSADIDDLKLNKIIMQASGNRLQRNQLRNSK